MHQLTSPKHSAVRSCGFKRSRRTVGETADAIRRMSANDRILLLSKLIECAYHKKTKNLSESKNTEEQNARWEFILDKELWSSDSLVDLFDFTSDNQSSRLSKRALQSEFKKLLTELLPDEREKILRHLTTLPNDERENIRLFLVDATEEHWSLATHQSSVDSSTLMTDIGTDSEKVAAQLSYEMIESLITPAEKEGGYELGTFDVYRTLIRTRAHSIMADAADNKDGWDAAKRISEVYSQALYAVISAAVNTDDMATAKRLFASPLFDIYRTELTRKLLFSCCDNSRPENAILTTLSLLNDIKANFNCVNGEGNTLLLVAVIHGVSDTVLGNLIGGGANANIANKWGVTPLQRAVQDRDPRIVQFLVSTKTVALSTIISATLHIVIKIRITNDNWPDYRKIIELLTKARHQPNQDTEKYRIDDYQKILCNAMSSHNNNIGLVAALINDNPDIVPQDMPYVFELAMFQLCFKPDMSLKNYPYAPEVVLKTPDAVKAWLKLNQNPNIEIPANVAKKFAALETFPGRQGCLLSHQAAACATRESLAILIENGLDIHAKDINGLTPLHYAAVFKNVEAIKLLVFAGTDINALDNNGKTPLHWLVANDTYAKNILCARILLYAGAIPDVKDKNHKTPLDNMTQKYGPFSWQEAFKTMPRIATKFTVEYGGSGAPSLEAWVIHSIANNSALTKNLEYRNHIPELVSLRLEEMISRQLTPP